MMKKNSKHLPSSGSKRKSFSNLRLLMDEADHAAFTGKACSIENFEGGAFSFCDGNHTGHFLKLAKNKRMVLAWTHKKFPAGHFSVVDLTFEKTEKGGTRISLNHLAVPQTCDGWLTEAWHKTYWAPLSAYVNEEMIA